MLCKLISLSYRLWKIPGRLMRHWPYRKSLLPKGRGVAPQWPWPAYLESSLTILQFALLHWLIHSPQNTMLSQLSSFIHVALQEFSLGKLSLFQDRALVLSDTGEEHGVGINWGIVATCWSPVSWGCSGLLPLQQRWRWSVDYKSLNCLSFSKTTSCPSVRLQDRGITQYKGTENAFP